MSFRLGLFFFFFLTHQVVLEQVEFYQSFIEMKLACSLLGSTFPLLTYEIDQFSSVQLLSHVRLCDPMNCSTLGLPVHHQLPEFIQTHVH